MQFNIKCATFQRLSHVCSYFEASTDREFKDRLSCIRLEHINGHSYAIVTNVKIAVCEYLGPTNQPNGVAHVLPNPKLIEVCRNEMSFDSTLMINTVPQIAVATATTTFGFTLADNVCIWPDYTDMDGWIKWVGDVDAITASSGFLYLDTDHMENMVKSSPSGQIYFAEFIDTSKPTVIRDYRDPNWVGIVIPCPEAHDDPIKNGAKLPEWWPK